MILSVVRHGIQLILGHVSRTIFVVLIYVLLCFIVVMIRTRPNIRIYLVVSMAIVVTLDAVHEA